MQRLVSVFQSVSSVALASVPFWLQYFIDYESKYNHLLKVEFLFPIIAIAIILLFYPQFIKSFHYLQKIIAKLAFSAIYSTRHFKFQKFLIFVPIFIVLIAGITNALHGALAYGYSLAREVRYVKEIGRQTLVEKANLIEKEGQIGSSLPTLRLIISRYPDDERNYAITRRIQTLESAENLATKLVKVGEDQMSKSHYLSAAEVFWSAYQVFPKDGVALLRLEELHKKVLKNEDKLRAVFLACKSGTTPELNETKKIAPYILREPKILNEISYDTGNGLMTANIQEALCIDVLNSATPDNYITRVLSNFQKQDRIKR